MRLGRAQSVRERGGTPMLFAGVVLAFALAGSPTPTAGQEASEASTVLTLERARALAMENNPSYRRSLNDLTLQDPAQRQLWAKWLPTLDLSAGTSQSFVRREIGTDDFGNPIPNPEAVTRWNSSGNQNLSFGVDLFNGRNIYAFSETRAQVDVWTRGAEATLVTVLSSVDREFYDAQRGAEVIEVEEEILRERERDLEVAQRLFNLAVRDRTDVLGTELAVRRQEQTVENARSQYERARIALQATLGRSDLDGFELSPAPVIIFDPAVLPEEELIEAAMLTNPRLLRESARVSQANAGVSSARSDRWPTLRLNGSVGRSAFGPDQSALFDIIQPSSQSGGSVSLSIGIPLFQQFQTSYSIAQAQVALQNAQEMERETRLDVEREIRERLIELRNAYLSYGLEEIALALAQERAGLVREEYQLATKSFEDLQVALRGEDEAQRAVVQARYAFLAARIALEEALGQRLDRFQEN